MHACSVWANARRHQQTFNVAASFCIKIDELNASAQQQRIDKKNPPIRKPQFWEKKFIPDIPDIASIIVILNKVN